MNDKKYWPSNQEPEARMLGKILFAWGMFTFAFGSILIFILEIPGLIILSTSIPFCILGMKYL